MEKLGEINCMQLFDMRCCCCEAKAGTRKVRLCACFSAMKCCCSQCLIHAAIVKVCRERGLVLGRESENMKYC